VPDAGGAADTLTGGAGVDWFWVFSGDRIKNQAKDDVVFDQAATQ
jgi:Ca2+-binding RTX toxin-like protein